MLNAIPAFGVFGALNTHLFGYPDLAGVGPRTWRYPLAELAILLVGVFCSWLLIKMYHWAHPPPLARSVPSSSEVQAKAEWRSLTNGPPSGSCPHLADADGGPQKRCSGFDQIGRWLALLAFLAAREWHRSDLPRWTVRTLTPAGPPIAGRFRISRNRPVEMARSGA